MIRKRDPKICLLNETHVTKNINNTEIYIKGYSIIRSDSESNRTGGVVAYVSKELKMNNIKCIANKLMWIISFDIFNLNLQGSLSMYADDTAVFYFDKCRDHIRAAMTCDLRQLEEFYRVNRLTLNLAKTQYINFEPGRRTSTPESISIGGFVVKEAESVKYLGITLDKRLCWKQHIESTMKRITGPVGILAKISSFLPTRVLLLIYNSLIHSHLSYLTLIWAAARQIHRRPIERLQRRALKRCLKLANRHSTIDTFQRAQVLPLMGISDSQLIEYVLTNMKEPANQRIFKFPELQRLRRGTAKLKVPRTRSCHGQASVAHRGARLYNELPPNITNINIDRTKTTLKLAMKRHQLSEQIIKDLI